MKKSSVLLIVLVSLTVFAGCIRTNPVTTSSGQGITTEQGTTAEQGTPAEQGTVITNKEADFIGEEEAKRIALEKAGVNSDDARFEKIELDRDDGIWQYEIEFRHGYKEYSMDVNAVDGSVRDYEVDIDD